MAMTIEEQIRQAYEAGYSEGYADGQYDSYEENGRYDYRDDNDNDWDFESREFDRGWAIGYDAGWKDYELALEIESEETEANNG